MVKQMRLLLLFTLMAAALQSCFVLKANRRWYGGFNKGGTPKPNIYITVSRKPKNFFLPLIWIQYNINGYGIAFDIVAHKDYGRIDSIHYKIFDEKNLLVSENLKLNIQFSNPHLFSKKQGDDSVNDTVFYLASSTNYNHIFNKKLKSIRVGFDVFTTYQSGKTERLVYEARELKRERWSFGSLL